MTTDNRTNEQLSGNTGQFTEAQVEAAAKVLLRDYQSEYDGGEVSEFLDVARAALVAAQGAARPVNGFDTTVERVKTGADSLHVAPVLPSLSNSEILERIAEQEREAAGAPAPQEPNQNETKSGNNFVSLDPEKVADVLNDHDYMYSTSACKCLWTGPGSHQAHQSEALCEAYKEGKLTK